MKKMFATMMAFIILLSALPAALAAEPTIHVQVKGSTVAFPDAQPFLIEDEVMLPVLFVFEKLGAQVKWIQETREVYILNGKDEIIFKPGEATGTVNGTIQSFGTASFIKGNRSYVPLSFIIDIAGYIAEYNPTTNAVTITPSAQIPDEIVDMLEQMIDGRFQDMIDTHFDEQMTALVTAAELQQGWESIAGGNENKPSLTLRSLTQDGPYNIVVVNVAYDQTSFNVTVTLNAQRQAAGLFISPVPADVAAIELPANIQEEEVIVGEGTPYELRGILTLPKDSKLDGLQGPLSAVVLVHGSGPQDRDETVGAYKPFRDIAWGLAQQGIAVLRYDKRTYVYGSTMTAEEIAALSVKEETVDDAIAAADLLRSDSRIDPSQVYLIGHSLGGMLAPRIAAQDGEFAGIVILAGSPRTLWEIIYDQSIAQLATMDEDPAMMQANIQWIESEMNKARSMKDMTDTEAMAASLFGIPAYYFKEMDRYNAADIASQLHKPLFILQGEDDFQVYANKDYVEWQELLSSVENVRFQLYPGLNHLFAAYEGEGKGTVEEYQYPGLVDEAVVDDIANWIIKHSQIPTDK